MARLEKIKWLEDWCREEGLQLVLDGECGFGRKCVGVASLNDGTYPDYQWYNKKYTRRADKNSEVWIPDDAYHKHPCTAVLGRGDKAIEQLYEWCKWFKENDFHYKDVHIKCKDGFEILMGRDHHHQMVKWGKK